MLLAMYHSKRMLRCNPLLSVALTLALTNIIYILCETNYVTYPLFSYFCRWHYQKRIIAPLLLLLAVEGHAKQLTFDKKQVDGGYSFHYQWLDHTKKEQTISFTLNNDGLFGRFRNFKSYQSSYAQKTILRRIKKHMQKNPIAGVQISYRQQGDNFFIEAKGLDSEKVNKAYQTLAMLEQKITQEYLAQSYYEEFTNHAHVNGIKVDHASIANDSVTELKPLKPIILAHVSIENIRKATNYVLGFVQNIPYNTLDSRLTSSGSGFNTPLKLLWENQGDCDSKMTLTASLLRALMPRIEMVFVYTEGHAFIGINIPAKAGEITITHNRITYLLAEPTGPAVLPLGVLAAESELAINQGHYVAQDYHEVPSDSSSKEAP